MESCEKTQRINKDKPEALATPANRKSRPGDRSYITLMV